MKLTMNEEIIIILTENDSVHQVHIYRVRDLPIGLAG